MALNKKQINEIIRKTILVLLVFPLVASSNNDCNGKAFYCVNSTHFMVCVDLGGGVSSTIDDFVIPCPPSTVCQRTNHYECEFPSLTTLPSTIEISEPSVIGPSETTTVFKEKIISTTSFEVASDILMTENNTVSVTQEQSITNYDSVTPIIELTTRATEETITTESLLHANTLDEVVKNQSEIISMSNKTEISSTVKDIVMDNFTYTTIADSSNVTYADITDNSILYNLVTQTINPSEITTEPSTTETMPVTFSIESSYSKQPEDIATYNIFATPYNKSYTEKNTQNGSNFTSGHEFSLTNEVNAMSTTEYITDVTPREYLHLNVTITSLKTFDLITDSAVDITITEQLPPSENIVTENPTTMQNITLGRNITDVSFLNDTKQRTDGTTYDTTSTQNHITTEIVPSERKGEILSTHFNMSTLPPRANPIGMYSTDANAIVQDGAFIITTEDSTFVNVDTTSTTMNIPAATTAGQITASNDQVLATTPTSKIITETVPPLDERISINVNTPITTTETVFEDNYTIQTSTSSLQSITENALLSVNNTSNVNIVIPGIKPITELNYETQTSTFTSESIPEKVLPFIEKTTVQTLTEQNAEIQTSTPVLEIINENSLIHIEGILKSVDSSTAQSIMEENYKVQSSTTNLQSISQGAHSVYAEETSNVDIPIATTQSIFDINSESHTSTLHTMTKDVLDVKKLINLDVPITTVQIITLLNEETSTQREITTEGVFPTNTEKIVNNENILTASTQQIYESSYVNQKPIPTIQSITEGLSLPHTGQTPVSLNVPVTIDHQAQLDPNYEIHTSTSALDTVTTEVLPTHVENKIFDKIGPVSISQSILDPNYIKTQMGASNLETTTDESSSSYNATTSVNTNIPLFSNQAINEPNSDIKTPIADTWSQNNLKSTTLSTFDGYTKVAQVNVKLPDTIPIRTTNFETIATTEHKTFDPLQSKIKNVNVSNDFKSEMHQSDATINKNNETAARNADLGYVPTDMSKNSPLQPITAMKDTSNIQSTNTVSVTEPYEIDSSKKSINVYDINYIDLTSLASVTTVSDVYNQQDYSNETYVSALAPTPTIQNDIITANKIVASNSNYTVDEKEVQPLYNKQMLKEANKIAHTNSAISNTDTINATENRTISQQTNDTSINIQNISSHNLIGVPPMVLDISNVTLSQNSFDPLIKSIANTTQLVSTQNIASTNVSTLTKSYLDLKDNNANITTQNFEFHNRETSFLPNIGDTMINSSDTTNITTVHRIESLQTSYPSITMEPVINSNLSRIDSNREIDLTTLLLGNESSLKSNASHVNINYVLDEKISNISRQSTMGYAILTTNTSNIEGHTNINSFAVDRSVSKTAGTYNKVVYNSSDAFELHSNTVQINSSSVTTISHQANTKTTAQTSDNIMTNVSSPWSSYSEITVSKPSLTKRDDDLLHKTTDSPIKKIQYAEITPQLSIIREHTPGHLTINDSKLKDKITTKIVLIGTLPDQLSTSDSRLRDGFTREKQFAGPGLSGSSTSGSRLGHEITTEKQITQITPSLITVRSNEKNDVKIQIEQTTPGEFTLFDWSSRATIVTDTLHEEIASKRLTLNDNIMKTKWSTATQTAGQISLDRSRTDGMGIPTQSAISESNLNTRIDTETQREVVTPGQFTYHKSSLNNSVTPEVHYLKETLSHAGKTYSDMSESGLETEDDEEQKLTPRLSTSENINSLNITPKTIINQNVHDNLRKLSETGNNAGNSLHLYCHTRSRGRHSDPEDCTKFYICVGRNEPIVGKCPGNTVFNDLKKQCTKNISHCIRANEFKCTSDGRFSNIRKNNAYFICIKRHNIFMRFEFQCQNGYYLNKTSVKCTKEEPESYQKSSSLSNNKTEQDSTEVNDSKESKSSKTDKKQGKSKEEFECKKEGKFIDPNNCKKYYTCTKSKKSEFRRRRKSCDSDEVFHNDKKKCVDADSHECL